MIKNTFLFLSKVSIRKEHSIHAQGIKTWNDFLNTENIMGISKRAKLAHNKQIREAKKHLKEDDSTFFAKNIPSAEHWRLYRHFRDDALFLDIESDGKKLTVAGFFDGYETKTLLTPIDKEAVRNIVSQHKIIVTFNGKSFDVPVLKKYFNLDINIPHIDLVHICRRCNLSGGLKEVEKTLGIKRRAILRHVKGHDAAALWRCFHATGDTDFLDMLIAYNEEDCINLKRIADITTKILEDDITNDF